MLGFGRRTEDDNRLPMIVQTLHNAEAFGMAQKVWNVNMAHAQADQDLHKEYLRFGLVSPAKAAWLQRDVGRADAFELLLTWQDETRQPEVYVLLPYSPDKGDAAHAVNLLTGILSGPATLPIQPQPAQQPPSTK